ncbi:hypothetical protein KC842_01100 [Candidatus Nomurabacteria bacterium]|nr:hypothetical protein [Candidatus Nomurabacteria bacterium]USN94687.1 MAG: hypothetical protein H6791_02940 [Candidatus Nomurabacteria bacterium]
MDEFQKNIIYPRQNLDDLSTKLETSEIEKSPLPKPVIKNEVLRTYSSDLARAIKEKKGSVIKIAESEERARRNSGRENKTTNSWAKASLLVAVLGMMVLGAAYLIPKLKKDSSSQNTPDEEKIYTENTKIIKLENDKETQIENIRKIQTPGISDIIFSYTSFEGEKVADLSQIGRFFDLKIPLIVTRSSANSFTFARDVYQESNGVSLIIQTDSRDDLFAGMLDWEKNIVTSAGEFFLIDKTTINKSSSGEWVDDLYQNIDLRIFEIEGEEVLLYGFVNSNTVIITRSKKVFDILAERVRNKAF